jgi:hypothetical protein
MAPETVWLWPTEASVIIKETVASAVAMNRKLPFLHIVFPSYSVFAARDKENNSRRLVGSY